MKRFSNNEKKYVLDVLKNEFRTSKNNIYNNKFESRFSEIFGCNYSIGQVNGTTTLHTALAAGGVKKNDEVIVTPLTMSSTSLCVLHNNSIPVFADVDPKTFNIDPNAIEKLITKKTKAVITVALYGLPTDCEKIYNICKENDIILIEDNAESFMSLYKDKPLGTYCDFASYSFQASKHITSGEGGVLTTNSKDLADKARKFTSLGYSTVNAKKGKITKEEVQSPNFDRHVSVGFNYRMSELQAAVLLGQLDHWEELVNQRIKIAKIFDSVIKDSDLFTTQYCPEGYKNTYWCYPLLMNTANPEKDWKTFRKIFINNGGDGYYGAWKLTYFEPLFLDEIQNYKGVHQNYKIGLCPNAEYLQPRLLQFKTHYWDTSEAEKQAEILLNSIKEFLG